MLNGHRQVAYAAILSLATTACVHTTVDVPRSELSALHHGHHHRALLLHDTRGAIARLDPSSRVRVQRTNGTVSPWFSAHSLRINPTGISGEVAVEHASAEAISAVAVEGLAAPARDLLTEAGWTPRPDGFLVRPGDDSFANAFANVVGRLAWLTAPEEDKRRDDKCGQPPYDANPELTKDCHESRDEFVINLYRAAGSPGLGRWTLEVGGVGRIGPIEGTDVQQTLESSRALGVTHGVPWSLIRGIQITNVNGGKSLRTLVGGILLYSTIIVATAPLSALFHANPTFPAIPGSADTPTSAGPIGDSERIPGDGTRLFALATRVEAYARPILTLDTGVAPAHPTGMWNGATAVVRFHDTFELGGGIRELVFDQHAPMGTRVQSRIAGSLRLGGHYDLDPRHRYAIALGFDLAALGGVDHDVRMYAGLRAQLGDHAFVGIYPANPTYAWSKSPADTSPHGWRLPSMVELGWAL